MNLEGISLRRRIRIYRDMFLFRGGGFFIVGEFGDGGRHRSHQVRLGGGRAQLQVNLRVVVGENLEALLLAVLIHRRYGAGYDGRCAPLDDDKVIAVAVVQVKALLKRETVGRWLLRVTASLASCGGSRSGGLRGGKLSHKGVAERAVVGIHAVASEAVVMVGVGVAQVGVHLLLEPRERVDCRAVAVVVMLLLLRVIAVAAHQQRLKVVAGGGQTLFQNCVR